MVDSQFLLSPSLNYSWNKARRLKETENQPRLNLILTCSIYIVVNSSILNSFRWHNNRGWLQFISRCLSKVSVRKFFCSSTLYCKQSFFFPKIIRTRMWADLWICKLVLKNNEGVSSTQTFSPFEKQKIVKGRHRVQSPAITIAICKQPH